MRDPLLILLRELAIELDVDLYVVGGFVRDFGSGVVHLDIDTSLVPTRGSRPISQLERVAGFLSAILKAESVLHPRFLTATVRAGSREVDLALCRSDTYPAPAELPNVEPVYSIEEDLLRRDFTVNAMALDFSGGLRDPFGGMDDLNRGILALTHDGSFSEDPTRAFRAVKYRHRLTLVYSIPEEEWESARRLMPEVSFERIRAEMLRMSQESQRKRMFAELSSLGLLRQFDWYRKPGRRGLLGCLDHFPMGDPISWVVPFSLFLKDGDLPSLPLSRQEERALRWALAHRQSRVPASTDAIHREFRKAPDASVACIAAYREDRTLCDYLRSRRITRVALSGDEIISLGAKRGLQVGQLIESIRVLRIDGEIKSREQEESYVRQALATAN